jgi:hypothetical protein
MEKRVYEYPYRRTRMGGLTKAIVVCLNCKKILEPSRVQRSKTGNHGTDYYIHDYGHRVVAVILEQSNSGKRYITVPDDLEKVMDLLHITWLYDNSTEYDIANIIKAYLMSESMSKS